MNRILLLCLLALLQAPAFSQFRTIAESPVFKEPEEGFARILQLKSGNTLFMVISMKNGIELKLYDAKRRMKTAKHLNPRYGKLKMGHIDAIFEAGGDAVLLVSEIDGRQPVLHRLVIDGEKGTLKKEETLFSMPPLKTKHGYAVMFGNVPMPTFYVHKDPHGDHYAVVIFNSFESDRNKRIAVTLYNGQHQEVSKAYYKSPDDKYKYMEYVSMAISGETVHVLGYAYNTRASGGKENVLLLGTMEKGNDEVQVSEMPFGRDQEIDRGVLKYNPVSGKLIFLAYLEEKKKKNKGLTRLAYIDPVKGTVESVKDVFPSEASSKSKELFGRKGEFDGRPVNFLVNPDGSFAVVFEELVVNTNMSTYTSASGGMTSSTRTSTELNDLAVCLFDPQGKMLGSYFIPKRQYLLTLQPRSFYHAYRQGGAASLSAGDQFKSFAYVNGKEKAYVLFNDVEENGEKAEKGKLTTIKGVSDCDAFCYALDGKAVLPARDFLFGKPARKKDHNLVLFAVSDYDREKNIYVAVRLKVQGRDKGVQLVWMEPS